MNNCDQGCHLDDSFETCGKSVVNAGDNNDPPLEQVSLFKESLCCALGVA